LGIQELIEAGMLKAGDILEYREQEGCILPSGWIEWNGHSLPDLVVWAIEVRLRVQLVL